MAATIAAIAIAKAEGRPGEVYYPLQRLVKPAPVPKEPTQVVVTMLAAALNHRDLFIRQHLYPGTAFGVPLLADGCGVVTAAGDSPAARRWLGKRVILNPGGGWRSDPDGPEGGGMYSILGGTSFNDVGTLTHAVLIDEGELELAPAHLSAAEAAALPLAGLTAFRAAFTKAGGNVAAGRNVLVTGAGGGVALMAVLFGAAVGANVYVSSGDDAKIARAVALGARGGVNYKDDAWDKKLLALLPGDRPFIDTIIDGAGGNIVQKGVRILKEGGVIVSYGMTLGPKVVYPATAFLRNIEIRGTKMGSRLEFQRMVELVTRHGIRPPVSRVLACPGLDDIAALNGLFEDMREAKQFGKLVVKIADEADVSKL